LTDSALIVEAGGARTQGADFARLPALARRLGVSFEDATPPRHLTLPGAGGIRLHALDWDGDGPPVLFLHGGRLTAQTWDYVCLGLRNRIRAVALDLRGHGDSDRADDYAFESQVLDVGAVLDALAWPKAHLVGMSYGGLTAAHFAAAEPQRLESLVTVDVGPGVVFAGSARMRGFFQRIDPGIGPEAVVEAAMQTSPLSDRARVAYRMAAMMRRNASGDWTWAYDERRVIDYPAILAKVEEMMIAAGRLAAPCLVVRGGRSEVFSDEAAARFAACFARGQWVAISDAGHNVQEDNPVELIAALARFWSQPAAPNDKRVDDAVEERRWARQRGS
jgi:pimeloyl-ACP methyl ester carboxylesterase